MEKMATPLSSPEHCLLSTEMHASALCLLPPEGQSWQPLHLCFFIILYSKTWFNNIFSLSLSVSLFILTHFHQQTCCFISHLMKINPPFISYPSVTLPHFSATLCNKTSSLLKKNFLASHSLSVHPNLPSVSITPLNMCLSRLQRTFMLTNPTVPILTLADISAVFALDGLSLIFLNSFIEV